MATILLLRHGQTHWNKIKRIQGVTDAASPLTLTGLDQARAYGQAIRTLIGTDPSWRVVASPLARCVQTTAILCETAGLDFHATTYDDRLREVDTGIYTGWLRPELAERHPELMSTGGTATWYFRCPGGDTYADMAARIGTWLAERAAEEKLVVVSHGVASKVLRGLYAGLDPDVVLAEDAPQNALFLLKDGTCTRLPCDGVTAPLA
jgi:probable phosphoglycerate mutase